MSELLSLLTDYTLAIGTLVVCIAWGACCLSCVSFLRRK